MGHPSDLVAFALDGERLTDMSAQLSPLGALTFIRLNPTMFCFKGKEYSLSVSSSVTAKELKNKISEVIQGRVPPERLDLLFHGSALDDDMTLADLEYGPTSPPLAVQEKPIPPVQRVQVLDLGSSNEKPLLFRVKQRSQDIRLTLPKTAKVGRARKKVAEVLGVNPQAITFLLNGKDLGDKSVLSHLNIGTKGIHVEIRE
jgi:hypothetical protein